MHKKSAMQVGWISICGQLLPGDRLICPRQRRLPVTVAAAASTTAGARLKGAATGSDKWHDVVGQCFHLGQSRWRIAP